MIGNKNELEFIVLGYGYARIKNIQDGSLSGFPISVDIDERYGFTIPVYVQKDYKEADKEI